jgi:hypothetical protein
MQILPGFLIGMSSALFLTLLFIAPPVQGEGPEAAFLAEMGKAMGAMMAAMDSSPTGDVDKDFVDLMLPHHQGAIDMSVALLKYGKNERLKRIAQEIIVEQQQEISAMKLAIGDPLPPSSAPSLSKTPEVQSDLHPTHHGRGSTVQ